jgi:hypothetical protein
MHTAAVRCVAVSAKWCMCFCFSNHGGSSSSVEVAGVTEGHLAMGVVPVGVLHERSFYAVNTGACIGCYQVCRSMRTAAVATSTEVCCC